MEIWGNSLSYLYKLKREPKQKRLNGFHKRKITPNHDLLCKRSDWLCLCSLPSFPLSFPIIPVPFCVGTPASGVCERFSPTRSACRVTPFSFTRTVLRVPVGRKTHARPRSVHGTGSSLITQQWWLVKSCLFEIIITCQPGQNVLCVQNALGVPGEQRERKKSKDVCGPEQNC